MVLKIEMLRCFCAVAQTGNLADAANRLGRTQSAVSMTLSQIEEHLGKKLFEGERKNRLSPLGEQVFELALKQVRQFDQTVQSMERMAGATLGLIRVVSVPSVAAIVFPAVLTHMAKHFPGVKIELRDTDSQSVFDALSEGKADIGIASGYHAMKGINAELLFEDRFGLVCAAEHPLNKQSRDPSIDDVIASAFVHNALSDLIQTPRFSEAIASTDVAIHNTHSLIAMVHTGQWVTVLPKTVVKLVPANIVFKPISDLPDKRPVYLYQRENTRFRALTKECARLIGSLDYT